MNHQTHTDGEEESLAIGRTTEQQSTRRDTSDEAYCAAELSDLRMALLMRISERPSTCDEIMESGWSHQSASATINWLMRKGLIVDSGEKRLTSAGRRAIVWRRATNPVPIESTRPTRAQLQARIDRCLAAITTASRSEIKAILEGK